MSKAPEYLTVSSATSHVPGGMATPLSICAGGVSQLPPSSNGSASCTPIVNNSDANNIIIMPSAAKTAPNAAKLISKGVIRNPYAKKKPNTNSNSNSNKPFVGGAEAARRKARRGPIKILNPLERERQRQRLHASLPRTMNPLERFGAALLRSPAADFVTAGVDGNDEQAVALWKTICRRVDLAAPTQPVRDCYQQDAAEHFAIRAALVLEEARHALAEPLTRKFGGLDNRGRGRAARGGGGRGGGGGTALVVDRWERPNRHEHARVHLRKETGPFDRTELFHIRPGTVYACVPRDAPVTLDRIVLGMVTGGAARETVEKSRQFGLTVFRDVPNPDDSKAQRTGVEEWRVLPIATLITEIRCFEAMSRNPNTIPFLQPLLGNSGPTYIRFDDDGNPVEETAAAAAGNTLNRNACIEDIKEPKKSSSSKPMFHLPPINATQEKAATTYLNASPGTITLCQGPPGTGKTTLLVNIIGRYLMEAPALDVDDEECERRRLMVCAPTNKAILVLASRFLASIVSPEECPFNVIMVGDGDKLLAEDQPNFARGSRRPNLGQEATQLRSIFVYSWMQNVIEDYKHIHSYFHPKQGDNRGATSTTHTTPQELYKTSMRLAKRLSCSLPNLSKHIHKDAARLVKALKVIQSGSALSRTDVVSLSRDLIKALETVQKDHTEVIWAQLVATADVIFCTLASAGGKILRQTARIHDLIVDEAAASTEPELCIPMHLRPLRMLCVGDPLQLPATVMSRRAIELGLSQSLHERLMYKCGFEYTMLDVQYRMHPDISLFPSACFYGSKIENGENVLSRPIGGRPHLLDGRPYIFLQCAGVEEQDKGGSYRNHAEARHIIDLLLCLRSQCASTNATPWHATDKIRVISFYQAQVSLLKRMLREHNLGDKVVVATVDSSQGCEADIVLVSFVRSPSSSASRLGKWAAGFLTDDRRMNVALTRARFQLVCVANVHAFPRMYGAHTIQSLASNAQDREAVHDMKSSPSARNVKVSGAAPSKLIAQVVPSNVKRGYTEKPTSSGARPNGPASDGMRMQNDDCTKSSTSAGVTRHHDQACLNERLDEFYGIQPALKKARSNYSLD